MAGNSTRKGAVRGSKKGPSGGTGGKNKKRLTGKGPTPKAEDRPYHAAAKRKKAAVKRAGDRPGPNKAGASRLGRSEKPKGEIAALMSMIALQNHYSLRCITNFQFAKFTVQKSKASQQIAKELSLQSSLTNIQVLKRSCSARSTQHLLLHLMV